MLQPRPVPALMALALALSACQVSTPTPVPQAIAGTTPGATTASTTPTPGASGDAGAPGTPGQGPVDPAAPGLEVPIVLPSPDGVPEECYETRVRVRLPGSGLPYRVQTMANGIERVVLTVDGPDPVRVERAVGPADTVVTFRLLSLCTRERETFTVKAEALNASGAVMAASDRFLDLDAAGSVRRDAQGRAQTLPGSFTLPVTRPLVLQLTLGAVNTKVTL